MPTNLIVNGTFNAGNFGWSGNDLETNHRESAYLGNGSNNRVAEMDGRRGQITEMEQTFTVEDAVSTELTFDSALRVASNGQAGSEGFTVEIVDSSGTTIANSTILPTTNFFTAFSVPVTFPSAGDYTLRMTELGRNDSLGAIVDNIELLVCFHGSTRIETVNGPKPARDITEGDLVMTERGLQPVRWVGRRRITAEDLVENKNLRPVTITAGALGGGLPKRDIRVSRQHRMLVCSKVCQRMFGTDKALVAAIRLTCLPGIFIDPRTEDLDYVHILFDEHEIVLAEGAPSESLLLGDEAKRSLSPDALQEIADIFPDTLDPQHSALPGEVVPALPQQKKLVERLAKNKHLPLSRYQRTEGERVAA